MINEISILIPVYNDIAVGLVDKLHRQASAIDGLKYEILVVDDGSDDKEKIGENSVINGIENCRYVVSCHHSCRSAMRNAMQEHARYEWRLMVDARLSVVYDDFLLRYLRCGAEPGEAVCGGVEVRGSCSADNGGSACQTRLLYRENLRFRYEKYEERNHSIAARREEPYKSFRTTNIFYHRSVLERVPYDESIKGYGYEDVKLGKDLCCAGIRVLHIDNPVAYTSFEGNERYLEKIEEALHTLRSMGDELVDFSPLLTSERKLRQLHLWWAVRLFHLLFGKMEKQNLCGKRPILFVFKLYKLGYLSYI